MLKAQPMTKWDIKASDHVELEIPLSNEKVLENITGRVLECLPVDDGFYRVRVGYIDIPQNVRDEIVRFVCEELEKGAKEVQV